MTFFNQKEEVLDIQLTQFGKNSLSRGVFRPVYYRFFDDDILYNIDKAGRTEHQNDAEDRILKQTPRIKTLHLSYGVETNYYLEDEKIMSGTMSRFEPIFRNYDPEIQESLLSYPMGNKETGTQNAPAFSILAKDSLFSGSVSYITSSGIVNKIPQLSLTASVKITRDYREDLEYSRILKESHLDLLDEVVVFKDGTRLVRNHKNLMIDIEEINSFYGSENFAIELFEVVSSGGKDTLKKIDDFEKIRNFFKIKTDEDADPNLNLNLKSTNYSRRDD